MMRLRLGAVGLLAALFTLTASAAHAETDIDQTVAAVGQTIEWIE